MGVINRSEVESFAAFFKLTYCDASMKNTRKLLIIKKCLFISPLYTKTKVFTYFMFKCMFYVLIIIITNKIICLYIVIVLLEMFQQ